MAKINPSLFNGVECKLTQGRYGPELIVRSAWTEEIEKEFYHLDVKGVRFLGGGAYLKDNLVKISKLPGIHLLQIVDWAIDDIGAIDNLSDLRQLSLSTQCPLRLSFENFAKLERLSFEWQAGGEKALALSNLKHLFINRIPKVHIDKLSGLKSLESLALLGCPASNLNVLSEMRELQALRIGLFRRLESNQFLSSLVKLSDLWVQSCGGFHSIDVLQDLILMRVLILEGVGNIESLIPLSSLSNLERVALYENTNIVDGKLSVLKLLPHLCSVMYANRRHYDTKSDSFPFEAARVWNQENDW